VLQLQKWTHHCWGKQKIRRSNTINTGISHYLYVRWQCKLTVATCKYWPNHAQKYIHGNKETIVEWENYVFLQSNWHSVQYIWQALCYHEKLKTCYRLITFFLHVLNPLYLYNKAQMMSSAAVTMIIVCRRLLSVINVILCEATLPLLLYQNHTL